MSRTAEVGHSFNSFSDTPLPLCPYTQTALKDHLGPEPVISLEFSFLFPTLIQCLPHMLGIILNNWWQQSTLRSEWGLMEGLFSFKRYLKWKGRGPDVYLNWALKVPTLLHFWRMENLIKGSPDFTSKREQRALTIHLPPQSLQELLNPPEKHHKGREGNAGEEGKNFVLSVLRSREESAATPLTTQGG